MQHLPCLWIDDVDDDPSAAPAFFKVVAVLVRLPGMKSFVQEGPGQFLLSMNLQRAPSANTNILMAKVAVSHLWVI